MTGTAMSRRQAHILGEPDRIGEPRPTTKKRMEDFLRVYAETGDVALSAKICGIIRTNVYTWRQMYPFFDAQVREVQVRLVSQLESIAFKQALAGDSQMIRFLLEKRWKAMYGNQIKSEVTHEGAVDFRVAGLDRKDAARELAKRILAATDANEDQEGDRGLEEART